MSPGTDLVTALLGIWFGVGLMIDAWAHSNLTELETFFTPWHAVFYSGFTVVSGWIIWQVWRNVRAGRQGPAAVPTGYLAGLVAIPAFAAFGLADMVWHTVLGIETTIDIFFSPSHLGLVVAMLVIITTPLRSAWNAPDIGARPSLGRLLPALLGLAFAATLVSLFLSYGDAMQYRPERIVQALSMLQDSGAGPRPVGPRPVGPSAERVAVGMVVTNVIMLSPVLFLVRRWLLPFGSVTLMYTVMVLMPGAQTAFRNVPILLSFVAAGLVSDLLIRRLRPSGERRAAYWAFAGLSAFATWSLYIGVASATGGGLPAVPELWTGAPAVAGLIGLALGALFLPDAVTAEPVPPGAAGPVPPGAAGPVPPGAAGAERA
ncbi:hypothetical protein [Microtetraspora sp. NBRC 13810]|uniref:hypothetical protein n=1 Tax=Microtetraspora sp. NBRC 13810 TaxID=3030990 RepID=UPI002557138D|nr:hypothetical protein [Microtetraspora sp. NBRC 13810]